MTQLAGTGAAALGRLDAALPGAQSANSVKSASSEHSKLVKAAGEFESILLQSLWKSMKDTFSDPDDGDSDPTLQSFDDWGMNAMASSVGNSGGLGIKNMILKYLGPTLPEDGAGGTPNR